MAITGGNLGLKRAWGAGYNGWGPDMDLNLLLLDTLAQPVVKSLTLSAPPGSPLQGDAYIVGGSPTGSWSGKANQIAVWDGAAWQFSGAPKTGWWVYNVADTGTYQWTGSAWTLIYNVTAAGLVTVPGGINLGQQNLKNYAEGTWTPTLAGDTTAGSHTYSIRNGRYARIGRLVVVDFYMVLTAKDAAMAGNVTVTGLPFTAGATYYSAFIPSHVLNIAYGAGNQLGGVVFSNSTLIQLETYASGAASSFLPSTAIVNNSALLGTVAYQL